jgi:hypothetical protein
MPKLSLTQKSLHKDYKTLEEIKNENNVSYRKARQMRYQSVSTFDIPQKQKEQILQLLNCGLSIRTIAKTCSISTASVCRIRRYIKVKYIKNSISFNQLGFANLKKHD